MDGSFADAPVSIAELKSDKSSLSSDWTARDLLVSMLRKIDSEELVISNAVFAYIGEDNCLHYRQVGKSGLENVGLLYAVAQMICKGQ